MKKINIAYWIFTGLLLALMTFSAIPDVMLSPDAVVFMKHLGYPDYFTVFIGAAKLLGVIAILVPGFPRVKEWAYAGFVFDLVGATYSVIAVEGFNGGIFFMIFAIGLVIGSYTYHHKRLKAKAGL